MKADSATQIVHTNVSDEPIWRYISLAKYVDLLRTKSLYFPKAARFDDDTEGKWFGHALLYEASRRWSDMPDKALKLEELLARAGNDPEAIFREAALLYEAEDKKGDVCGILTIMARAYPHKRREVLESTISAWRKNYDNHNNEVEMWASQTSIYRESTYISCWNRAQSMSLAMWELYGRGREAVAVKSTKSKLALLFEHNSTFLEEHGLDGAVSDVSYVDGLKNPDEQVHDRIYEITTASPNITVGMFSIKPSMYAFEQEVRAIIFPKRDIFSPLTDPHPNCDGFSLNIEPDFIEEVYVHPTLSDTSMMVEIVGELNRLFDVPHIPIVADRIEAFGRDIRLEPRN